MAQNATVQDEDREIFLCSCCKRELLLEVLESNAGFYLGTFCPEHGPEGRESARYWKTRELAQEALDSGKWIPRI